MDSMFKSTTNRQKIFDSIFNVLKSSKMPVSTTDISKKIKKSWHTVDRHCLKLQLDKKITGYKIGNMNIWEIKK